MSTYVAILAHSSYKREYGGFRSISKGPRERAREIYVIDAGT